MAERVITKRQDGFWTVSARDSDEPLSFHERCSDALARVTTVLLSAGGGRWVIQAEDGRELKSGRVARST